MHARQPHSQSGTFGLQGSKITKKKARLFDGAANIIVFGRSTAPPNLAGDS